MHLQSVVIYVLLQALPVSHPPSTLMTNLLFCSMSLSKCVIIQLCWEWPWHRDNGPTAQHNTTLYDCTNKHKTVCLHPPFYTIRTLTGHVHALNCFILSGKGHTLFKKKRSGYYGNLGSLRAGTRHHGDFSVMGTSSLQPFLKSYWLTPVKRLANCRKACKYDELETV